jgi:hypothetical protein
MLIKDKIDLKAKRIIFFFIVILKEGWAILNKVTRIR